MNIGKNITLGRGANIDKADEVTGNAVVGNGVKLPLGARLTHDALVLRDRDVLVLGPGPSGAYTTAHRDVNIGVRVNSRCYSGSVPGFRERLDHDVTVTPAQRAKALEYIDLITQHFAL